MLDEATRAKREKSPPYPAASIECCFDFIKIIDSLGSKSVSYSSILEPLGITSVTTRSFLNRLSASKQFGLIITGGNTAQLTDIARKILYPNDDGSPVTQLKMCFDKPPLYSKLIERFKNKAVPSKAQLSNILMNDFGIIKNSKDNAAECFISSAEYLGFLPNGVLVMEIGAEAGVAPLEKESVEDSSQAETPVSEHYPNSVVPIPFYNSEIPMLSGKSARISIPKDVTEKDLDYIDLYIQSMLPAFIKNLKEELEKQ